MLKKIKEKIKSKHLNSDNVLNADEIKFLQDYNCEGCRRKCKLNEISCSRGKIYQNERLDKLNK